MSNIATDVNLWEFYDTEKAGPVPSETHMTLWRFYQFAISTDTEIIELRSLETSKGKINMYAYGPVCDNALDISQKGENQKFCRLFVKYEMTKKEIHDKVLGLEKEEQRTLIRAVGKKARSNSQTTFCKVLGLQGVA